MENDAMHNSPVAIRATPQCVQEGTLIVSHVLSQAVLTGSFSSKLT